MAGDSNFSKQPGSVRFAVVAGVLLIVFGLWRFLAILVPAPLWGRVPHAVQTVMSFAWPVGLIVAGVYLLWAAKTGRLAGFKAGHQGRTFTRSRDDKRLFGVCGGIAYYFGVDSTIVRILAVLLLIIVFWPTLIAYFLIALVVPQV